MLSKIKIFINILIIDSRKSFIHNFLDYNTLNNVSCQVEKLIFLRNILLKLYKNILNILINISNL
jgi:hypothetical protein